MTTVSLQSALMTPDLERVLKSSYIKTRFRYELLGVDNASKGYLDCVLEGGSISYNYLATDIKRTANFTIAETGNFSKINFLIDRIKPYVEIFNPVNDKWMSYPKGVFVLNATTRDGSAGVVTRNVEAYDLAQTLKRRKHPTRFVVPKDSDPVLIVRNLLDVAGIQHNIQANNNAIVGDPDADLVKAERTFDPGGEFIVTINTMLDMIGYDSLWFDDDGVARSEVYVVPADRTPDVVYVTDSESLITEDASVTQDSFEVANVVLVVVSQTDRAPIVGTARNESPNSPTSTYYLPESVIVYTDNEDVTTQAQANAKALRLLTEASQVYETISFSTPIVPVHSGNNIVAIQHSGLGIEAQFKETAWTLPLRHGEYMQHTARRVVRVS